MPLDREYLAVRELAVAALGGTPEARKLVEDFGETGVRAVNACSIEVGKKLAAWHSEPGGMSSLPRPGDFLALLAGRPRDADEIALWVMGNAQRMRDLDNFEAVLHEPLEVILGLKRLEQAASENRARRLAQAEAPAAPAEWYDHPLLRKWGWVGLAAAAVFAALWLRARRSPPGEGPPRETRPDRSPPFELPKLGPMGPTK